MKAFHRVLLICCGASFALGVLAIVPVITSENGYVAGYVFFPLALLVLLVSSISFVAGLVTLLFSEKTGLVIVLTAVSLVFGFIGSGLLAKQLEIGAYREEPMVAWPAEVSNVVLFKKGTTYEQRKYFEENVIATPRPDGRGHEHLPGVWSTGSLPSYHGHDAYEFSFFPSATDEQKRFVYERIRSSPIVQELREDVTTKDYMPADAPEVDASDNRPKKTVVYNGTSSTK